MFNADFEKFYKRFHLDKCCVKNIPIVFCPYGAPTNAGCKKCWREYIEQQEPVDTGEVQGELFGGEE